MTRSFRLNHIINIFVVCSLTCSILLLIWNSSIEYASNHEENINGFESNNQKFAINIHENDATYIKFHTTFHFNDPLKSTEVNKRDEEAISLLKEELKHVKLTLKELKEGKEKPKSSCNEENRIPKCQILHIAIVCAGYKETRRVVTLVKSILFHRENPLHFHFISDAGGRHVLHVLFKTWSLQNVKVSYYDADALKHEVEWIPNSHYSGVYGLMKLTLTKALPEVLDKVIVLDTDVFFLTDVAYLWKLFDNFTESQAIGLVENQSEWYTGKLWKKYKHWPALGRGFNTGVMLFDLKKLRAIHWAHLWRLTAEKQLVNLLSTVLADQDVINAALKDNPQVVYTLPCEWNIQLSDNTQSASCYEDVSQLKIIHWNSPKKQGVKHKHAESFRNMYLTFLQYDGNLLRKKASSCAFDESSDNSTDVVLPEKVDESNPCLEFLVEQKLSRRVHLFYFDYSYDLLDNDVTLLAHLSMDRLQILISLVDYWQGPMSIALYASDAEVQQFLRYAENSETLKNRKNIGIHIVYKDGDLYPVNYLRNIALEQVQTEYVFLCDIDFLPVTTLYQYLREVASNNQMTKKAMVVPAFETYQYKLEFPETKPQLLSMLDKGKLEMFRESVWPQGHAPTDYEQWKRSDENYKISWQADYEPYVMVETKHLPYYDMRFVGFGWNKVSHIMELHAAGYEFYVLAKGFIIHMPHAPSFDITKYRTNSQYRRCLRFRKEEFRREIEKKYKIEFR